MIFKESRLSILDNSGVKEALCIRVLTNNPSFGIPGMQLTVTIKKAIPKKFRKKRKVIKKGEIHRLLLVSSRKGVMRLSGHQVIGIANHGVMLRKDNPTLPFGNRLRGVIFREVRDSFGKLLLMAANIY